MEKTATKTIVAHRALCAGSPISHSGVNNIRVTRQKVLVYEGLELGGKGEDITAQGDEKSRENRPPAAVTELPAPASYLQGNHSLSPS